MSIKGLSLCGGCGAPLASMVKACEYCGLLPVLLSDKYVPPMLAHPDDGTVATFKVGEIDYKIHGRLGTRVFLARRYNPLTEMVVLKLVGSDQEWIRINRLRNLNKGKFLARLLPEPLQFAKSKSGQQVLVYRWRHNYKSNLSAWQGLLPTEIGFWLSFRLLEQLHELHESGYSHGQLSAEHMLLHHHAHSMVLCGWSACSQKSAPDVEQGLRTVADALRPDVSQQLLKILYNPGSNAWKARGQLRDLNRSLLGAGRFYPLVQVERR